jgi:hypothetical protein
MGPYPAEQAVGCGSRSRAATCFFVRPSAQPSMIRDRNAGACDDLRRRSHCDSVVRSPQSTPAPSSTVRGMPYVNHRTLQCDSRRDAAGVGSLADVTADLTEIGNWLWPHIWMLPAGRGSGLGNHAYLVAPSPIAIEGAAASMLRCRVAALRCGGLSKRCRCPEVLTGTQSVVRRFVVLTLEVLANAKKRP